MENKAQSPSSTMRTSLRKVFVQIRNQEILRSFTLALLLVTFVCINARNSMLVTFVWEEWYHLLAISEGLLEGILWGGRGYMNPLGNAFFILEVQIFGDWYPGYVVVNSLIVVGAVILTYLWCPPRWRWLAVVASAVFLFSGSVLYTTAFGNEVSDLLAILFGSAAVWTLMTQRSALTTSMLLCLSVLSNNLVGIVASVTVAGAVMFFQIQGETFPGRAFRVPALIWVLAPVAFAGALGVLRAAL